MADLFPKETLDAFESSTRVNSWSADLALSVKMQFDLFEVSGDLRKQMQLFKFRIDSAPELAELNMMCQAQRITPEDAKKHCLESVQERP